MPSKTNAVKISYNNTKLSINAHEIIYMKGHSNYTFLNTIDGKCYVISKTMKEITAKLSCPFIRIHRSYSVNPDYFVKFLDSERVLLSNGEELPVARRRIFNILKILNCSIPEQK
jgi:two-component system LytT family response regulator